MFKLRFITRQHLEGLYRPQCRIQQHLHPGGDHEDTRGNNEEYRRTIPPQNQHLPLAQTLHIGALLAVGYNFVHGCLQSKKLRERTKVDLPYTCPIVLWRTFYASPPSSTSQYSPSTSLHALPQSTSSKAESSHDQERADAPKNGSSSPVNLVSLSNIPEFPIDVTFQETFATTPGEESKPLKPTDQVEDAFNELVKVQHDIVSKLGNMHGVDRLMAGSAEEGVALLEMAASEGSSAALYNLGVAYENGLGGRPKDPTIALRFYERASDLGHPAAKFNLAVFYHQGRAGLHKNTKVAKRLMIEACQGGQAEACRILGVKVPEEKQKTNEPPEIESPVPFSSDCTGEEAYRSARAHHFGLSGLSEDPFFALELYRTAAEQGHDRAKAAYEDLNRELNPPDAMPKSLRVSESSPALLCSTRILPKLRRASRSLMQLEEMSPEDSGLDRRWEIEPAPPKQRLIFAGK